MIDSKDRETIKTGLQTLFRGVGENFQREGLVETPSRWLSAMQERLSGYDKDPRGYIKVFHEGAENVDELIIVHNIPIVSMCEHHMADILGYAHVGYIPSGGIIGLSKIPRIVDAFAKRLQVQERLTNQIADCLFHSALDPIGVGVLIHASHACISTRGVKIHGSMTTTSALRGDIKNSPSARAEFLDLCRQGDSQ